ncbi:MAG: hypothetical protein IKN45_09810 [Lachnospiraceae bacterium]|nr:hypothetical protein [Lachnospiraceae bacterium]
MKLCDEERFVLFLDIDGVLQPTNQWKYGNRFKLSREELNQFPQMIAEKTGIEHLSKLYKWDVAAVYLDWSDKAVTNLKDILNNGIDEVEIVLSSSWRESKSLEDMKALFAIHGLDGFLKDMCPTEDFCSKRRGIELYLELHPMLHNYIVVDDENLLQAFPGHAVYCRKDWLDDEVAEQIKSMFHSMRERNK